MAKGNSIRLLRLQIALLALIFLLGMALNLFVTSTTPGWIFGTLLGAHVFARLRLP